MEFKEALQKSLKADKHTYSDPFFLHSMVSDLVGNDYEAKKAAEQFYRLDAKHDISKTLLGSVQVRYKKHKKHYYKIKPMPIPPDNAYVYFDDTLTLHLSGECSCLKNAVQIDRTTYDHARKLDFQAKYQSGRSWFYRMRYHADSVKRSQKHIPRICRRCGDFVPKKANGIFYKLAKFIFNTYSIDIHQESTYSPTRCERFKAYISRRRRCL